MVDDNARFCSACGQTLTPPEPDEPSSWEQKEAATERTEWVPGAVAEESLWGEETPWENPAPQEPREPRQRKPLPKWVIPVGAAAAALIALVVVLQAINTPERAVDRFLEALEDGDAAAAAKASVLVERGGEVKPLTAEQLQPLVRLCTEDEDFLDSLEEQLESQAESVRGAVEPSGTRLFSLQGRSYLVFTDYAVAVGVCDTTEIQADLPGDITLEDGQVVSLKPDSDQDTLLQWCSGTVEGLLPGRYSMEGTLETDYGVTITGTGDFTVQDTERSYGELRYDYTTVQVYNSSHVTANLVVAGQEKPMQTLEPGDSCVLGPLQADTQIEARAVAPLLEEPPVVTFDGASEYQELWFQLSALEVYNDYNFPLEVYRGDELVLEVPAEDSAEVAGLAVGTELTIRPAQEGVAQDCAYTLEDEGYSYTSPRLELTEETDQAVQEALTAHLREVLGLYNSGNLAALEKMADHSAMAEYWCGQLEDLQKNREDGGSYGYRSDLQADAMEVVDWRTDLDLYPPDQADPYSITVEAYARISVPCTSHFLYTDGEDYTSESTVSLYTTLYLQYADGTWTVVA